MVLFDQPTYDKLLSEAPKYKLITPSILLDRLRIEWFNFISGMLVFQPNLSLLAHFILTCKTMKSR